MPAEQALSQDESVLGPDGDDEAGSQAEPLKVGCDGCASVNAPT